MFAKQGLTVFVCLTERSDLRHVTINDKIIETLSSYWVTSENKTIHTPSPPIHLRTERWLFPTGSKQQHNIAWKGWGRKSIIFPFSAKHQKWRSVSTNFVPDCRISHGCKLTWPVSSESRSVRGGELTSDSLTIWCCLLLNYQNQLQKKMK